MYRTKEKTIKNIFLGIICILAIAMGILNKSYLISGMYILTLIPVAYMMKDEDSYSLLYGILLVSTFYDYVIYVPGIRNIYLFHIVLGLFTIMTLYRIFKDKNILFRIDKKVLIIFIIWFVYMCTSITWALNKQLAIKYIAIYIMMFCFILDMMIYNINKERLNKTINLIVGLISLIIIIGFIEVLLGHQLPVMHHYDGRILKNAYDFNALRARPIVFSYNPNNLAATLGILVPICFFSISKFKNVAIKIYFIIISSMGFALVVLTTSRTGLIAILFGFSVYVIYCICSVKRIGIKALVCPIILILSFTFLYYNAYKILRIESMGDGEFISQNDMSDKMKFLMDGEATIGGEGSISERLTIIYDVVNDVVQNKNILGNGVGNVYQFLENKHNTMGIYNPHSYAIEILADFGVPGVILYGIYYLYLLIGNIILGIKKKNIYCFVSVAGLIAFMPASFGPSSITYVFSYWMLMAFSISTIQVSKNSNEYTSASKIKEFRVN